MRTVSVATASSVRPVYVGLLTAVLFGLLWAALLAFLRVRRSRSLVYLLFFTIFYVYLYKVLDYTLFQFQSLLLLKYLVPNLMLKGLPADRAVNLVPLATLAPQDLETSLLNVLLMVPFGFGLPFVTRLHARQVIAAGALFSIAIECLQFVTGFLAGITFRVADVDDVIFNTLGVAIGYILFPGFVRLYGRVVHNRRVAESPISRFIAERPQVGPQPG